MTPSPAAQSRYLDARVMTASQPELQLMLLDGALRFGRQAQALWDVTEQRAEWERLLDRTFDIVEELVRSAVLGGGEASKRLEEEYAFAFRQLARARLGRDAAALEAALNLLSFHRETWKLACDKLKGSAPAPAAATRQFDAAPRGGLSLQG
jgi:flagellar protein FliS